MNHVCLTGNLQSVACFLVFHAETTSAQTTPLETEGMWEKTTLPLQTYNSRTIAVFSTTTLPPIIMVQWKMGSLPSGAATSSKIGAKNYSHYTWPAN